MIQVNPHNAAFIMSDSRTFRGIMVFEDTGTESVSTAIVSAEVSFTIPEEDIRPGMVLTSQASITVAADVGDQVEGKHFELYLIPQFGQGSTTHGDLKFRTHGELEEYTHGEIKGLSGESIPLGRFKATAVKLTGDKTTIEAHDDLYGADRTFTTGRAFPCSSLAIEQDICNALGIAGVNHSFDTSISAPPEDCTYREMLGFIAALDGGKHAMIDRNGYLIHKDMAAVIVNSDTYTVSKSRSAEPEVERNEIAVTDITCVKSETTEYATHNQAQKERRIIFTNPYMTQAIFNTIAAKYVGLTYKPLSAKYILGDPRLELLDIVSVEGGKQNASWTVPLTSLTYSYDGGLSCTLVSGGKTDAQSDTTDGPMTRYVKQLVETKTDSATEALRESMKAAINYILDPIQSGQGGYHFQAFNQDGKLEADYWTDNPNLSQASHIIMINQNGIAGTDNGINGDWRFAIESDGKINADYILAGTLSAITLQSTNYSAANNTGSILNLANGTFSFGGGALKWNGAVLTIGDKFTYRPSTGKLDIEGKVTVSDTDSNSKAILDDARLKLYRNNDYLGFVGTQTDANSNRGIVFDLTLDADYMSWGAKDSANPNEYTQRFNYYRSDSGNNTAGFNMFAHLNMHDYDINNAEFGGDFLIHDGSTADIYRNIDMHGRSISNANIVTSSDRRLKENIKDSEVSATDVIRAIKPREFDWKADGTHEELGFIADELGAVKDKFAATMSDGTQGIKLLELVPYLVKAFQELDERVSRLEHDN